MFFRKSNSFSTVCVQQSSIMFTYDASPLYASSTNFSK
jgi:hypothetical protein